MGRRTWTVGKESAIAIAKAHFASGIGTEGGRSLQALAFPQDPGGFGVEGFGLCTDGLGFILSIF